MKKIFITFLLVISIIPTYSILKQRKITVTKTIINKRTLQIIISDSTFVTDCVLGDATSIEYVKLYNGSRTYFKNGIEFEETFVAKLKN